MKPTRVPFGEWLPDLPAYANPGALEAKNCFPQARGYRQLNGFQTVTQNATEELLGAIWSTGNAGTVDVLAGTATRLLRLAAGAWTNVATGFTSVANWEFERFGVNVAAVASGVDPQIIDLSAGSPSFSAIVGSPENPPRASRIGFVRDFLVLGNLDSDSQAIQWSGFNNALVWDTTGRAQMTQADIQPLPTGGNVQKVVSGQYGLIFQENEIRIMRYVGPPTIFNIQVIDRERGCAAPNSVVSAGDQVFFYALDGFFALRGGQFVNIGEERVNRWFLGEADSSQIINMRGSVDRRNRVVAWAFKTPGATVNDRVLFYNYAIDRWSYGEVSVSGIFELRSEGYTLDTLDTILTGGPDNSPILLDSTAYLGGDLAIFGADANGALGTFSGEPLAATIDTQEFDGGNNQRAAINGVRPLVEGDSATVTTAQIGQRELLTQVPRFSEARGLNEVGEAPFEEDNRYNRVRLNITGGFEHAVGVDVEMRPSARW